MTCSKGPQGGIKPVAAALRTQPLFMWRALYQLSYKDATILSAISNMISPRESNRVDCQTKDNLVRQKRTDQPDTNQLGSRLTLLSPKGDLLCNKGSHKYKRTTSKTAMINKSDSLSQEMEIHTKYKQMIHIEYKSMIHTKYE